MRIGCLQFAPQLGDVDQNLNRADAVLSKAGQKNLDLLVLPELAFTGYNFKSLKEITPFLEPTASGISSLWARTTALKHDCVVIVGYPEKVDVTPRWPTSPEYYNSAITVNSDGKTVANYRKSFLYYTDETWALEGPDGFYEGEIEGLGNVALGIFKWPTRLFEFHWSNCSALWKHANSYYLRHGLEVSTTIANRLTLPTNNHSPYKFEAPWSAWEFAYHVLHRSANLAVISMAWLTREDPRSFSRSPREPDMETLAYWVARLEPLIRNEGEEEIIVVLANRTGTEGDACYAGTSAVLGIQSGEVKLYGVLGRGEKELLVVDTSRRPQAKLVHDSDMTVRKTVDESDKSQTSKSSKSSKASKTSQTTQDSVSTRSSFPDDDEELILSIDEVLATCTHMSPVEPMSPHVFFGNHHPRGDELKPLVSTIEVAQDMPTVLKPLASIDFKDDEMSSPLNLPMPLMVDTYEAPNYDAYYSNSNESQNHTLKSVANGNSINRAQSATPGGSFERPSSPKSRNASRTRHSQPQEVALYSHDLAGDEERHARNRSRAHSRSGHVPVDITRNMSVFGGGNVMRNKDTPHSAGDVEVAPGIEVVRGDDDSDDDFLGTSVGIEPIGFARPKSVGW